MCRKNKAYTLIEVLIAMLIFSFIAAMVVGAVHNIFQLRDRVVSNADRLAEIQKAMSILDRDLEQVIKRSIRNSIGRIEYGFEATGNSGFQKLNFTRAGYVNPLNLNNRSTLQRVGYRFKNNQLIRVTWSVLDRTQEETPTLMVLLTNISSVRWWFYDKELKTSELWPITGKAPSDVPRAIALEMTLADLGKIKRMFLLSEHDIEMTAEPVNTEQTSENQSKTQQAQGGV